MSRPAAVDPNRSIPPHGVELVLLPRAHGMGGFEVRRALPARERQMVGPFILFIPVMQARDAGTAALRCSPDRQTVVGGPRAVASRG